MKNNKRKNLFFTRLWGIFFFCGVLSNFPLTSLWLNVYLIVMFLIALFYSRGTRFTMTTYFILILTFVSIINTLFINSGSFSSEKSPSILPILSISVLTAEWLFVPKIYNKVQVYNCLPLAFLFLLGGFHLNNYGRIQTDYLSATTKDVFYLTGYCTSLYLLLNKKINKVIGWIALISCLVMILVSGSRKDSLFILLSVIFLYPLLKHAFKSYNIFTKLAMLLVFFVVGIFYVNRLVQAQLTRFDAGNISEVISFTTDEEASALEREDYISTGFIVAYHYPLGVGEGNIVSALSQYGGKYCKMTYNVHSLLAQVLFDGGFLGLLLLILLTYKLIKISFIDIRQFYAMPLFFALMIFTGPMFLTRILWPLLVFYEKEIYYIKANRSLTQKRL